MTTLPRMFQLWRYDVSHGFLLLRSPKDSQFETRIDVGFKNVTYIALPSVLPSLSISVATNDQLDVFLNTSGVRVLDGSNLYVINANYYVVAGFMGTHEDSLEYYEESTFSPIIPS